MPEAIDILENRLMNDRPDLLAKLLADHTTRQNIFWATDSYAQLGEGYQSDDPITVEKITGDHGQTIRPRAVKAREEQQRRSREMAEVFTPSWLCNEMNNEADAEWFGRADVFNTVDDHHQWKPKTDKIAMPEGKTWQDYVTTTRLEITCGEAPFLVSRYDTVTGEVIPLQHRIGLLDRKLRVVTENATDEEWTRWALLALGSVYGYEWQGDSLLLAREAVLETFVEYYEQRFNKSIDNRLLGKVADIVSWNLWQMDGLKGVVPNSCREVHVFAPSLFGAPSEQVTTCKGCATGDITLHNGLYCNLRRWLPTDGTIPDHFEFSVLDILKKKYKTYHKTKRLMKFDYIIGNPPYQDETIGEQKTFMPPIYDKFMDDCYSISDKVELVTPGRFLFNAGSTPKAWNLKMLKDEHLKVLDYHADSSDVFPGINIMGGVAVTFHNTLKKYEPIGFFSPSETINSIVKKVQGTKTSFIDEIAVSAYSYKFTSKMLEEHPDAKKLMSKGHAFDLKSNVFETLDSLESPIFFNTKPEDGKEYIRMIGREKNERVYKYIRSDYVINTVPNFFKYKIFVASANGSKQVGEKESSLVIGQPVLGKPKECHTESFISIGSFDTLEEAQNAINYIKTKFSRCLLGIIKVTQHVTPGLWKYVPLQDFTSSSDIDWTRSVHEIDLQLYDKYGLTDEERDFIETHVKEM